MNKPKNTEAALFALAENLEEWGHHFAALGHGVALSLFRGAAIIRESPSLAGGGTVAQASTKPPSAPGGEYEPNAIGEARRDGTPPQQ